MTRSRDTADTQDNLGGAVAPFVAGKNKIINGNFGIWQRGTSVSPASSYGYTVDRWQAFSYGSSTTTVSQQTFTPASAPVAGYEGQYFARVNSTNNQVVFENIIEDVRTITPAQSWTVSFWARSQTAGNNLTLTFVQNFGTGGSANVNTSVLTSQALTTGWVRYLATFTAPSVSGKTIGANSRCDLSFLHPVNNYLEIWGVQLEAGSVATPFTTASGSIGGELALCQRYYAVYRTYVVTASPFGQTDLRPVMRTTPTIAGGGTGFTVLDGSNSFILSLQTAAAVQDLTFSSEL